MHIYFNDPFIDGRYDQVLLSKVETDSFFISHFL